MSNVLMSSEWEEACAAAYDPKTPALRLDSLARKQVGMFNGRSPQRGVAQHPNTSVDTLMYLTTNLDWKVLKYIACRPDATADLLRAVIAADPEVTAIESILEHPNTPPDVYETLAKSEIWGIRDMVAYASHTPPSLLTRLALDPQPEVIETIELNPNTPPAVKLWLRSDYRYSMTLEEFLKSTQM